MYKSYFWLDSVQHYVHLQQIYFLFVITNIWIILFSIYCLSDWKFEKLGDHLNEIMTIIMASRNDVVYHDVHLIRETRCQDVDCFIYLFQWIIQRLILLFRRDARLFLPIHELDIFKMRMNNGCDNMDCNSSNRFCQNSNNLDRLRIHPIFFLSFDLWMFQGLQVGKHLGGAPRMFTDWSRCEYET